MLQGKKVRLAHVLANKEQRNKVIDQLGSAYPKDTIISLKCNIPGDVKNNHHIHQFFVMMEQRFIKSCDEHHMMIQVCKHVDIMTGPETVMVIAGSAVKLKEIAMCIETEKGGRLLDIDVYFREGKTMTVVNRAMLGMGPRACFVCSKPAKECSSRQNHTLSEITQTVFQLMKEGSE